MDIWSNGMMVHIATEYLGGRYFDETAIIVNVSDGEITVVRTKYDPSAAVTETFSKNDRRISLTSDECCQICIILNAKLAK